MFLKLGAGAFPVETHDSGAHAGLRRAAIEPAILDLVCQRPPRPRPAALRTTRRSRTAGARRRLSRPVAPRATSRSAARGDAVATGPGCGARCGGCGGAHGETAAGRRRRARDRGWRGAAAAGAAAARAAVARKRWRGRSSGA